MHPPALKHQRAISIWLSLCALLVVGMVTLGGYTRLSGSGLSITQWKPLHGFIPPLNEAEWEEEFAGYKQIPQYSQVNTGMQLAEFKRIFWPEFWHRVLARTVGFVFFIPLVYFAFTRSIRCKLVAQLSGIFALGGVQGFIGWYMVSSGLSELAYVSHLRLALHLGMAFIILGLILWVLMGIIRQSTAIPTLRYACAGLTKPLNHALWGFTAFTILLFMQIILGALLAGLHGGLVYNSFPTMNGQWIHKDIFLSQDDWLHNIALIQFAHRWLAALIAISGIGLCFFYRVWFFSDSAKALTISFIWLIFIQFLLGVFTLLHQAPLNLALAHQLGAALLFSTTIMLLHRLHSATKNLTTRQVFSCP